MNSINRIDTSGIIAAKCIGIRSTHHILHSNDTRIASVWRDMIENISSMKLMAQNNEGKDNTVR